MASAPAQAQWVKSQVAGGAASRPVAVHGDMTVHGNETTGQIVFAERIDCEWVTTALHTGSDPDLTVDQWGNPHVTFQDGGSVFVASRNGTTWTIPAVAATDAQIHASPQIGIYANGLRIAYYDADGDVALWSSFGGASIEVADTNLPPGVEGGLSMAVEGSSLLILFKHWSHQTIELARPFSDSAWTSVIVDDWVDSQIDLGVDATHDLVHIVYSNRHAVGRATAPLTYSEFDEAGATLASIAVDELGIPFVAYRAADGTNELRSALLASTRWYIETVATGVDVRASSVWTDGDTRSIGFVDGAISGGGDFLWAHQPAPGIGGWDLEVEGPDSDIVVMIQPNGEGQTLVDAGGTVDVTVHLDGCPAGGLAPKHVTLVDVLGNVQLCFGSAPAHADTDALGRTSFTGSLPGGGWTDVPSLAVALNDLVVTDPIPHLLVNSPDIQGDLQLSLSDLGSFAADYLNPPYYHFRSDLEYDGQLDLADIGRFYVRGRVECRFPDELASEPSTRQRGLPGLRVRLEQTSPPRPGVDGEYLEASVVLEGLSASHAVRAWQLQLEASANLEILRWNTSSSSLALEEEGRIRVGEGIALRPDDRGRVRLGTVSLRNWNGEAGTLRVLGEHGVSQIVFEDEPEVAWSLGSATVLTELRVGDSSAAELAASSSQLSLRARPVALGSVVRFELPTRGFVEIRLFDASGRLVETLVREGFSAGVHEVTWDGTDSRGQRVAAGVYFGRMRVGDEVRVGRVMVLR